MELSVTINDAINRVSHALPPGYTWQWRRDEMSMNFLFRLESPRTESGKAFYSQGAIAYEMLVNADSAEDIVMVTLSRVVHEMAAELQEQQFVVGELKEAMSSVAPKVDVSGVKRRLKRSSHAPVMRNAKPKQPEPVLQKMSDAERREQAKRERVLLMRNRHPGDTFLADVPMHTPDMMRKKKGEDHQKRVDYLTRTMIMEERIHATMSKPSTVLERTFKK